jgi:hypothetical protein
MRHCRERELAELWRAAGPEQVRFAPLVARATYANFEDLWSPFPSGVAPSGAFCKSLDHERRVELHDAYRRRLDFGDGPLEPTARAWGSGRHSERPSQATDRSGYTSLALRVPAPSP